jgi:hypothetical protein
MVFGERGYAVDVLRLGAVGMESSHNSRHLDGEGHNDMNMSPVITLNILTLLKSPVMITVGDLLSDPR